MALVTVSHALARSEFPESLVADWGTYLVARVLEDAIFVVATLLCVTYGTTTMHVLVSFILS
jgi:hypothetical protein